MAVRVFLGMGTNLGDRRLMLERACGALAKLPLEQFQQSSVYETLPYRGMDQPAYYNQAATGLTHLSPQDLLKRCLEIERHLGRVRHTRWESRIIDIDILFYGDLVIDTPDLVVPHRDFQNRGFVLTPLLELAPNQIDPRSRKSIRMLYEEWREQTQEMLPQLLEKL